MQQILIAASVLLTSVLLSAQSDRWAVGGTVGLNCARIQVTGVVTPTKLSGIQPTPAFGVFFRTALGSGERTFCAFEFRGGYETSGAAREVYYERATEEWVRINDRYSTVPLSALGYVSPGGKGKLWLGAGLKGQYVIKSRVRNHSELPPGSHGFIFEPQVRKLFPSVCAEAVWSAQLADIAFTCCYALTPLIKSEGVTVTPMSLALTVKKRLALGPE